MIVAYLDLAGRRLDRPSCDDGRTEQAAFRTETSPSRTK